MQTKTFMMYVNIILEWLFEEVSNSKNLEKILMSIKISNYFPRNRKNITIGLTVDTLI